MDTKLFTAPLREAQYEEAAAIIRGGGLLGIPTETVYGLGANALDEDACRRIYEAKGRPQDNPLIIHVADTGWLPKYCRDIPPAAYQLAEKFWPGPLTMILPKQDCVPMRTTGGLDTVGIRCPDHPLTLEIIRRAGVPIAAPSGNTSGRPSPTTAQHMVEDMWGKIDGIADGGPCGVGVESTIIDLTCTPPRLLRPGGLPLEKLEEVLGEVAVDSAVTAEPKQGEKPKAPGMAYRHYAPKAPVTVVVGDAEQSARYILRHCDKESGVICFHEYLDLFQDVAVYDLGHKDDKAEQAHAVFDALRAFDSKDVSKIFAQCPDSSGLGLAVENRLKKAAGFHVVDPAVQIVVGITGGTGCGKTTALTALESLGFHVIDCDRVYHELLVSDLQMLEAIAVKFPDAMEDGTLQRKKLGQMVFQNKDALDILNKTVWPFVGRAVKAQIEATSGHCAIDAIGLFESGLSELCTHTVAVTAPRQARIDRLMQRDNISEEYAALRIDAQKGNETFAAECGVVLDNHFPTQEEFYQYAIKTLKETIL